MRRRKSTTKGLLTRRPRQEMKMQLVVAVAAVGLAVAIFASIGLVWHWRVRAPH